jgi:multiple sugar transport system ATP-binding protein
MRAEIKQLHQVMQTTFVYVTHDQAEALTLADRIVVMRSGVVQQIGKPDDIYERPRNMFVASFLGNPPINFMDGTLEVAGDRVLFRRGELALALPPHIAERVAGQSGRAVVLGIRAEDVVSHSGALHEDGLQGRILSVLPVGSDQFLEVEVEGTKLYFRVGKEGQHKDGENVTLKVNLNRLHLFDKQDSQSLVW